MTGTLLGATENVDRLDKRFSGIMEANQKLEVTGCILSEAFKMGGRGACGYFTKILTYRRSLI